MAGLLLARRGESLRSCLPLDELPYAIPRTCLARRGRRRPTMPSRGPHFTRRLRRPRDADKAARDRQYTIRLRVDARCGRRSAGINTTTIRRTHISFTKRRSFGAAESPGITRTRADRAIIALQRAGGPPRIAHQSQSEAEISSPRRQVQQPPSGFLRARAGALRGHHDRA